MSPGHRIGIKSGSRGPDYSPEAPGVQATGAPRIWLVLGDKLGDNAQVRVLADALGWPYEERILAMRSRYVTGKPWVRPSLHHINLAESDALAPPWPDLILTCGRRPSMAALWIAGQSGGKARVVMVGRPRRLFDRFDLIVTFPPYRLPARPNIHHLQLPLMRLDETEVRAAAAAAETRFADMPRPLTALLVGGPTKSILFDRAVAERLIAEAARLTEQAGGSLYVTTSRRTPAKVIAAIEAGLPAGGRLYRWAPGVRDNPYRALLGLADRFIVTGDSISMLVEVARLGKPLAVFAQPPSRRPGQRLLRFLERCHERTETGIAGRLAAPFADGLNRLGLVGYSRRLGGLHQHLVNQGFAVPLGQPFPTPAAGASEDLAPVAARIKSLLA